MNVGTHSSVFRLMYSVLRINCPNHVREPYACMTRKFSLNGLVDVPFHYITHPLDDSVILIH